MAMQSTVCFIAIICWIKINGRCKVKPKSIIISYLYLILIPLSIIPYLLQYCYDKFHDFNENFALLAFMSMFGRLTAFLQQAAEVTSQVVSKMSSLLLWFGTFAINHNWALNRIIFFLLFVFAGVHFPEVLTPELHILYCSLSACPPYLEARGIPRSLEVHFRRHDNR